MQWQLGTLDDKDLVEAYLKVDGEGEGLAAVYVNYHGIGWQVVTDSAWDYCRMVSGTHVGFPDVWSAMEAAEEAVREAIAEYQRRGAWQPDLADFVQSIDKRNEWLRNEGR